jgi:hypothetical protein
MALSEKDKNELKCIICKDPLEPGRGRICNVCYDNMRKGQPLNQKKKDKK